MKYTMTSNAIKETEAIIILIVSLLK